MPHVGMVYMFSRFGLARDELTFHCVRTLACVTKKVHLEGLVSMS